MSEKNINPRSSRIKELEKIINKTYKLVNLASHNYPEREFLLRELEEYQREYERLTGRIYKLPDSTEYGGENTI